MFCSQFYHFCCFYFNLLFLISFIFFEILSSLYVILFLRYFFFKRFFRLCMYFFPSFRFISFLSTVLSFPFRLLPVIPCVSQLFYSIFFSFLIMVSSNSGLSLLIYVFCFVFFCFFVSYFTHYSFLFLFLLAFL